MGKTIETIKALEEFADEQIEYKKKAQRELDDLKYILNACLRAMPCSYIPNHTIENLPAMIKDQVQRGAEEYRRAESLEQTCEKLVEALQRVMKWMDESGYYDVSPYHQAVEALAITNNIKNNV